MATNNDELFGHDFEFSSPRLDLNISEQEDISSQMGMVSEKVYMVDLFVCDTSSSPDQHFYKLISYSV